MGQCGCSDTEPMYQFPGPDGVTYGIQIYPSCHYCSAPAGVELYRFGVGEAAVWLDGVPEAPFRPYSATSPVDADLAIPVLDPEHLGPALAEVCDPDDMDQAIDSVRMHLDEAVHATLDAWRRSTGEVASDV